MNKNGSFHEMGRFLPHFRQIQASSVVRAKIYFNTSLKDFVHVQFRKYTSVDANSIHDTLVKRSLGPQWNKT